MEQNYGVKEKLAYYETKFIMTHTYWMTFMYVHTCSVLGARCDNNGNQNIFIKLSLLFFNIYLWFN